MHSVRLGLFWNCGHFLGLKPQRFFLVKMLGSIQWLCCSMQTLLRFFAFWVWQCMCHNCGLRVWIVAYFGAIRNPQNPVCALWLQGSSLFIHALSSTGSFSNCGTSRAKAPEVSFCQNARQHSVTMLPCANPVGVSIQGLAFYVPQL